MASIYKLQLRKLWLPILTNNLAAIPVAIRRIRRRRFPDPRAHSLLRRRALLRHPRRHLPLHLHPVDLPRQPSAAAVLLFHQPLGAGPAAARGGLDLATINNMPIVVYRSLAAAAGNFSEAECCICLGIFGDKEIVKVMPDCRHWFHSECVDKWLAAQSSCPICRAPLRVDSPV
ncbi:hypothetical protein DH2020_022352 [Rehmannia glutinosa]|uniref:RING-type E3 ubiquitin transferase n=1 Tax=Rehmannia glutinosa TaxID=99300 RepID=A0ABR0WD42_REHGL